MKNDKPNNAPTQVFTKEESLVKDLPPITRSLRMVFVSNKITEVALKRSLAKTGTHAELEFQCVCGKLTGAGRCGMTCKSCGSVVFNPTFDRMWVNFRVALKRPNVTMTKIIEGFDLIGFNTDVTFTLYPKNKKGGMTQCRARMFDDPNVTQ